MTGRDVLTADDASQLEHVAFGPLSPRPSASAAGSRVGHARGFGLEFQDFRRYRPGDDPRSIDWTIHARLQQLVVRTYRADASLRVHVLLDASASMALGTPDKLACAKKLAAMLTYVAVQDRDAVGLATFATTIGRRVAPGDGRAQLHRILQALADERASGRSSLNRVLTAYADAIRGPGLVVVLSDFFEPAGAWNGLEYLIHRGLTPAIVQIVAPEEIDPSIDDDTELVDVEDPGAAPLVVDGRSVADYRARFAALSESLAAFCRDRRLPWMQVQSSFSTARLLHECVQAGVLAGRG